MRDSNTEREGIYATALIFTKDLKWIFREQPIVDVGIDALIEEVISNNPTGQFIAAQIKSGEGNFHVGHNHWTYYISKIHYHYWLNFNLPVILVGYFPTIEKAFWEVVSKENLKKTKTQWKIQIPKNKELNSSSIKDLTDLINGNTQDDFISRLINGEVTDLEFKNILLATESFTPARESIMLIGMLIGDLGNLANKNSKQIGEFGSKGYKEFDKRVMRSIKLFSEAMNSIRMKLNKEIVVFSESYSKGISAYEKIIYLNFHFNNNYKMLNECYLNLVPLYETNINTIDKIKFLRNSISALPNKYAHLKKSKNSLTNSMNQIIEELKIANSMNESLIKTLEDKLR